MDESTTLSIGLHSHGRTSTLQIRLPELQEIDTTLMLPVLQAITDETVHLASVHVTEDLGRSISCKNGCGACCRQAVPISATEARNLKNLVASLSTARRQEVVRRFQAASQQLQEAGLLEQATGMQHLASDKDARQEFGLAYFKLGIACPFLNDESCSIYNFRPLACREYLVTSPAHQCAELGEQSVEEVPLPGSVSAKLRSAERKLGQERVQTLATLFEDSAPDVMHVHPQAFLQIVLQ